MGQEIDLLTHYPKTKRNIEERCHTKTEEDCNIARKFGREFFDGDRKHGYGGFLYHPRFWQPVVPFFQKQYSLNSSSKILDIGCAKGFMLYDFQQMIPGIQVRGLDISEYAIHHAKPEVHPYLQIGCATQLPFEDQSFDLVISITTLHNLEREKLIQALREIERVSKGNSYITVDAYKNEAEKKLMHSWNLTAKTILHTEEWKELFHQAGYKGDYYWFSP